MGNMEQVEQGSQQFHPISEDFDTGVDDICNPKRFIVWTTHMNTHILPEYIISFKLAPPWNGGYLCENTLVSVVQGIIVWVEPKTVL